MFEITNFTDKVNEFMLLHNYTPEALSANAGISLSTVYNLLKGRYKQPDTKVFFRIIELFNCSADYMLGLVEFPLDGVIYHSPLLIYGDKLRSLLKKKGETQKAFIENMKISSNLAYKWLSNISLPTIEYLIRLAEYFEISVDTLIERVK